VTKIFDKDRWARLWAPHRRSYLLDEAGQFSDTTCPFCIAPKLSDVEGLIVHRGQECYVVMNKYPYNTGHLLVCTYRHIAWYDEITNSERDEMSELTQRTIEVLKRINGAKGFNIGLNQGEVAGAGVAGHIHQHVVPRWANDSNFMPIIGQTKVMSELIEDTRKRISEAWTSH
jgi:ATP adenylyltransferase